MYCVARAPSPASCDDAVGHLFASSSRKIATSILIKSLRLFPRYSKNHKVLSLCFVDPNDIGIRFSTLQTLAKKYVDFIALLALYMDALRAEQHYIKNTSKIDQLLGTLSWFERWKNAKTGRCRIPSLPSRGIRLQYGDDGVYPSAFLFNA